MSVQPRQANPSLDSIRRDYEQTLLDNPLIKRYRFFDRKSMGFLLDEIDRQQREIVALRQQIEGHCARIAAQSDLLTQRAEKKVGP